MTRILNAARVIEGGWDLVTFYDKILARMNFLTGIDEIALYTRDHEVLDATVADLKESGLDHFNSAKDHVHTQPLRTCYDVRYEFLKVPGMVGGRDGFRFECMALESGLSPLHHAKDAHCVIDEAKGAAVHASFKCEDEEDYAITVGRLRQNGWESAQRCESDYGRFSYWSPLVYEEWPEFIKGVWLKPRVNKRDA